MDDQHVTFTYPDTGERAWFCVCARSDCQATAVGPYRSQDTATEEAKCDAVEGLGCAFGSHFVTQRIGRWMPITGTAHWNYPDLDGEAGDFVRAHNEAADEAKNGPAGTAQQIGAF